MTEPKVNPNGKLKGKVAFLEGKMLKADDGSLVAETEASFMVVA